MAESRLARFSARAESARTLAARLPDLLVQAQRIAANVMLGVHGRRHPGPGDTFWQFRPYMPGESARQIDWRRSARDNHLYVREREWEASQTIWLWVDLSPSMDFNSRLSQTTKLDRAVVLMLALADLLGRGGERVGIPGLAEPRVGRDAANRFAQVLAHSDVIGEWPSIDRIRRFSEVVIFSDFLSETEAIRARLRALVSRDTGLHLLQVFDPAEEALPYSGRLEFRDPESGTTWLTERAEGLRSGYLERLEAHRGVLRGFARRAGSSFQIHHTDHPAAEGLLFLQSRLVGDVSYASPRASMRGDPSTQRPAA